MKTATKSSNYYGDNFIAMKVVGNSMEGVRIFDGDTVFFDRSHDWTTGNICLVRLDGQLMIKGVIAQGTGKPPVLRSANPNYSDIATAGRQFAVLGRLVTVKPKNFNPGAII